MNQPISEVKMDLLPARAVRPRPGLLSRGVGGLVGRLAASAYGWEVGRRNRRFDAGRGVVELDRPVISVGNLTVGGTGKTPMVQHILRVLLDAGRTPCVAMRGYGANEAGASDEVMLYREVFPELAIVAQPNRVEGLLDLLATNEGAQVDTIVLDDGFQHRRLARQFDIVLCDATHDVMEDHLLPRGWLREPVGALARAQAIVVTHAERVTRDAAIEYETRLWDLARRSVSAACRHVWTGLRVHEGGAERAEPEAWLRGKRVVAACAIGNPRPFVEQVRGLCGEVTGEVILRDHDPFGPGAVERIAKAALGAQAIVVTEKDWTKLARVASDVWPCPVVRPKLELRFDRGGEGLTAAMMEAIAAFEREARDDS